MTGAGFPSADGRGAPVFAKALRRARRGKAKTAPGLSSPAGLVVKQSFWIWPERELSGNTIDFLKVRHSVCAKEDL